MTLLLMARFIRKSKMIVSTKSARSPRSTMASIGVCLAQDLGSIPGEGEMRIFFAPVKETRSSPFQSAPKFCKNYRKKIKTST